MLASLTHLLTNSMDIRFMHFVYYNAHDFCVLQLLLRFFVLRFRFFGSLHIFIRLLKLLRNLISLSLSLYCIILYCIVYCIIYILYFRPIILYLCAYITRRSSLGFKVKKIFFRIYFFLFSYFANHHYSFFRIVFICM